ncbi:sulfotransferase domain-containing protein [Aestuariivirga sp.]|uniref:sulfotransferase domain-containing protein n=1 Tax=Aestuariivirga sp. TaxID=2650926 RepID=UPI003592F364
MNLFSSLSRWLKYKRWNRKKLEKFAQADVILLRYPKSGVTWLRVMITQVYRARLDLPRSHLIGSRKFGALAGAAPKIFVAMDNFGLPRDRFLKGIEGRKVVMLLRDPRDVVVSLYFHFAKRSTDFERTAFGIPDNIETAGMFAFVMNPAYGLPKIIDFMNFWSAALETHPQALVLRYEDLKADPVKEFTRVMSVVDAAATAEEIRSAVDFAAFEKMKAMEAEGSFGVDILTPTDQSDQDSYKVRRGKVGGYVDYFSADEVKAIDTLVQNTLAPRLGYGQVAAAPAAAG